jgi:microsomal epoxide hydrolase
LVARRQAKYQQAGGADLEKRREQLVDERAAGVGQQQSCCPAHRRQSANRPGDSGLGQLEVVMITRSLFMATLAALVAVSCPALAGPMKEQRIAVAPGVVLRTIEAGPATGRPPIVFIPGWSAGADIWRDQIVRFDDKHRVISFDPRSQGESSKLTTGNTPEQRAADLHALLARLHIIRPVLVGWSQAAQDLAAYALRYGTHDLSGIVLVDAAISDGANGIAERPKQSAFQFRLFGSYLSNQKEYVRGMFDAIVSKPQPAGVIDRAVAVAMKTPPSIGMSMLVSDLFTLDRRPALAMMSCPVMIIAAASSSELEQQKAEAKLIKNARFVQIDEAAHAVFLDQPDRFADVLASFLTELESRRSQ